MFPGEAALRAERTALVDTLAALEPADFEHGATLCAAWSPRDVLGHLLGLDTMATSYLRNMGRIRDANADIVAASQVWSREEMLERARRWAARPALGVRAAAWVLLGDLAVHHQDVLRQRERARTLDRAVARAILREGMLLGPHRLARHRVVPTDGLAPALGFGRPVRGTTEALGMWLAGRSSVAVELQFD
ncbi:MAG: maleylpyruvate isomerase mycothiol-dependent enzyme family protein [Mycobacteriales bacterium]